MARAHAMPPLLMCLNPDCGSCHMRHAAVYLSHTLLVRQIACAERPLRAWSLILEDDARMHPGVSAAQIVGFLDETKADIVFFNHGNCRPGGELNCHYGAYGYALRRAAALSLATYLTPGSPFLSTLAARRCAQLSFSFVIISITSNMITVRVSLTFSKYRVMISCLH